ncbi:Hsp20 family protein [Buchnera aphidicola]|uniref:Hsp20 family protein n=1 Tax=Buchnera aphidicola TaxID=9 RepID=UPI0031B7F7F1
MPYHSISFHPTLTNSLFSNRFNQIDKIFSTLTGEKPLSELPDYNLIKINEQTYQLTLTVPGYKENELDISITKNQLIISGKCNYENQKIKKIKYIHQGIQKRDFSITFNINQPIKIHQAKLKNGLLKINFEYEHPESKKIKKIHIQTK